MTATLAINTVNTATAGTATRFVVLCKSHYYGPTSGKWVAAGSYDSPIEIFASREAAAKFIESAHPLYLGHNESTREYRIHAVRAEATTKSIESDWANGKLITGGSLNPNPVKG